MPTAKPADISSDAYILLATRVWLPSGEFSEPMDLQFRDGELKRVSPVEETDGIRGGLLLPALTDLRARFGEPGFEYRETFATGLRAAAAGGFCRVAVLPFTAPVLDNPALIQAVRMHGGGNLPEILPIGALTLGLKGATLAELGSLKAEGAVAVSDAEVSLMSKQLLRRAMEYAKAFNVLILQHPTEAALAEDTLAHEGNTALKLGLKGCPAAAEEIGLQSALALVRLTGTRFHASALSTAGGVELVRRAKEEGLPVTADVGICHLALNDDALMGYDTLARHWPPLRSETDRLALLGGVEDGTLDAVCSDHTPLSSLEKDQEFDQALPGCSTLEWTLPILWSLVQRGELSAAAAIRAVSQGPADVLGLPFEPLRLHAEPTLGPTPAHFTLIQPECKPSTPMTQFSKSRNTPPIRTPVLTRVRLTVGNGRILFQDRLTPGAANASHGAP